MDQDVQSRVEELVPMGTETKGADSINTEPFIPGIFLLLEQLQAKDREL